MTSRPRKSKLLRKRLPKMTKIQVADNRDPIKIKKIFTDEFNATVDKLVKRSLELPTTYTSNAPYFYLGEATECFIHAYFNASIALSRATLEQSLKHKLGVNKSEVIDLTCLIKLASAQKLLNHNLRNEAIKVQKWGNTYIHDTKKKDSELKKQQNRAKEVLLSVKKIIGTLYS